VGLLTFVNRGGGSAGAGGTIVAMLVVGRAVKLSLPGWWGHQHLHHVEGTRDVRYMDRHGVNHDSWKIRLWKLTVLRFPVPTVPFSFILSMDTPSIPYIIMVILYRMFSFISYLSLCLHRSTEVRLLYTLIYFDTDPCSLL